MDRLQIAEQLRKTLLMFAATLSDEQAMEVSTIYDLWIPDHKYLAGDIVSYGTDSNGDPQLYRVIKEHTSQENWKPGAGTESIYDAIGISSSGYPIWSQPSGSHDAYNKGDIVSYNGQLYKSLIDGNTWAPDVYPDGWELYTE